MIPNGKFSVRFLGVPAVAAPDGAPRRIRTQKALALFARVAAAGPAGIHRENVAGLLWSRSPERQARTNLRQSLSLLTRSLRPGPDVIRARGPVLAVDRENVVFDIDRLADTAGPGGDDDRAAFLLSAGRFLEEVSLDEPDFADWLTGEQARHLALQSAEMFRLAETFLDGQRAAAALELARGLLKIDDLDEAAHRLAMRAFLAQGQPARALRQYDEMEAVLKAELGIGPSAASQEMRAQVRRAAPTERPVDTPGSPGERPAIAVLPFRCLSDEPAHAYFSDGLVEDITTQLSRFSTLSVIAREFAFAQKGRQGDIASLGQAMGARYIVSGSLRWSTDKVRISVQLIEAESGAQIWAEQYDRQTQDMFGVQDEVAGRIVEALPGRLQDDVAARAARKPADRLKAYELILRGKVLRDSLSLRGNREARGLLRQALDIDKGFARAHMYYSDTYVVECWFGLGGAEARRLALDHARRAVMLDSTDVYIQDHLGFAFQSNGMWDDAAAQIDKALANMQFELESRAWCGYALLMFGQRDRARDVIEAVAARRATLPPAFDWILGQLHALEGRHEDAARVLMGEALLNALGHAFLAGAYARLGRDDAAARALKAFVEARRGELGGGGGADTVETLAGGFRGMWRDPSDWAFIAEGLRLAGLPD